MDQVEDCWNRALHCFGTSFIFMERANSIKVKIKVLSFLGIFIPAIVGGVVIAFGTSFEYLGAFLAVAGFLGIIQITVSIWSLVSKWDDELSYSIESVISNNGLSDEFKSLAQHSPIWDSTLQSKYDVLIAKDRGRSDQDIKYNIRTKETRKGMRASLRQFQRACVGCKETPTSMESTNCDVCGKF